MCTGGKKCLAFPVGTIQFYVTIVSCVIRINYSSGSGGVYTSEEVGACIQQVIAILVNRIAVYVSVESPGTASKFAHSASILAGRIHISPEVSETINPITRNIRGIYICGQLDDPAPAGIQSRFRQAFAAAQNTLSIGVSQFVRPLHEAEPVLEALLGDNIVSIQV